ncbi:MAG: pyridoxal-phosphate dependent enzyme [bacterium]
MKRDGRKKVIHRCVGCGREHPHDFAAFCDCGHFIDIEYDLAHATIRDSADPYIRYFDLLPLEDMKNLLPAEHGVTPCLHARELGKKLGLQWLFVKDETVLPTGTTKDRMATVVLSYCREVGMRFLSASSTGNSSTAMVNRMKDCPEMTLYVFAAEDFLDRVQVPDHQAGNIVVFALRGATFVEACDVARQYSERKGFAPERGFFNPARREGLKTAFLEAAEMLERPIDWYVQAVSSAMGVYGAYKGARELAAMGRISRLPRLLCVQQESNRPMVSAFEAGSKVIRPQDIVPRPAGIAAAILRGDPSRVYPYVRSIVLESRGTMVSVSEQEIRDARCMVEDLEGLSPCFTASTAVAGLRALAGKGGVSGDETVLLNLTGRDRPRVPPPEVHWLKRSASGWEPEDRNDTRTSELWN